MSSNIQNKVIYSAGLGLTVAIMIFIAAGLCLDNDFSEFVISHSTILLIVCILLASILLHDLFVDITKYLKSHVNKKLFIRELEKKLIKLNSYEKYILSLFVTEKRTERSLDPTEPAVAYLESLKIILKTGKFNDGKRPIYQIDALSMRILSSNPNWLQ